MASTVLAGLLTGGCSSQSTAVKENTAREAQLRADYAKEINASDNEEKARLVGTVIDGYTVYFGHDGNGGMTTREAKAAWDPKTKAVTYESIRMNGIIMCKNQKLYNWTGNQWEATTEPLGCEFDSASSPKVAGAPSQVFINQYDYGKIAAGTQSSSGVMVEKVILK